MSVLSSEINGLINDLKSFIKEESCSLILVEAGWVGGRRILENISMFIDFRDGREVSLAWFLNVGRSGWFLRI